MFSAISNLLAQTFEYIKHDRNKAGEAIYCLLCTAMALFHIATLFMLAIFNGATISPNTLTMFVPIISFCHTAPAYAYWCVIGVFVLSWCCYAMSMANARSETYSMQIYFIAWLLLGGPGIIFLALSIAFAPIELTVNLINSATSKAKSNKPAKLIDEYEHITRNTANNRA